MWLHGLVRTGMLDIVDMDGLLQGDEEHISGWDLVYDNGFIEIDPTQCNYTTFLGAAVPEPDTMMNNVNANLANMKVGGTTSGGPAGSSKHVGPAAAGERNGIVRESSGGVGSRSRPGTGTGSRDRRGSA